MAKSEIFRRYVLTEVYPARLIHSWENWKRKNPDRMYGLKQDILTREGFKKMSYRHDVTKDTPEKSVDFILEILGKFGLEGCKEIVYVMGGHNYVGSDILATRGEPLRCRRSLQLFYR